MSGLTSTIERIDEQAVRDALEKMRQARSLRGSALTRLLWLQLASNAPLGDSIGLEVVIMDRLVAIITEQLQESRALFDLASNDLTPEEAIQQDFSQENVPLEAWSALYFRYVRTRLDWSIGHMAELTYTNPRYINRRMAVALRRLAEALNRRELEARQNHWEAWLRSKLPPKPYGQLHGFNRLRDELRQAVLTLADAPFVQVAGIPGVGKTALTHAVLGQLVTQGLVGDFAWLTAQQGMTYQGILAEFARALGYHHLVSLPPDDLETALRVICSRRFTVLVVDSAERLNASFDGLNRLEPLLGSGRVVILSRQRREMLVPTVYIQVLPPSAEAYTRILLDHIRLKRMPLHGVDKHALCERLYRFTGGNPLAGKLLLSEAARLDRADFEHLLTEITVNGEDLLPTLFEWSKLPSSAARIAETLYIIGGEASVERLADELGVDETATRSSIAALQDRFMVQQVEGTTYRLDPLVGHYIESYVENLPVVNAPTHAMVHTALRSHKAATMKGLEPIVKARGLWGEWRHFLQVLLQRGGLNNRDEAWVHHELGLAEMWFGALDEAEKHLTQAISGGGGAEAYISLARLHFQRAEVEDAQRAFETAISSGRQTGEQETVQRGLQGLTNVALHKRDTAILHAVLQQLDETVLGADYYTIHGAIALAQGEPQQAIAHYKAALAIYGAELDTHSQAVIRFRLGVAAFELGADTEAIEEFEAVLSTMRSLGDVFTEARTLANLGAAYAALGDVNTAKARWSEAARLQDALKDATARAYTLYNLGDLAWRLDAPEARMLFQLAWELVDEHDIAALAVHLRDHPALQE